MAGQVQQSDAGASGAIGAIGAGMRGVRRVRACEGGDQCPWALACASCTFSHLRTYCTCTEAVQLLPLDIVLGHCVRRLWFGHGRIVHGDGRRLVGRGGWRLVGRLAVARIRRWFFGCALVCSHGRLDCTIDTDHRFDRFRGFRGPAATGLRTGSLITLSNAASRTESFA